MMMASALAPFREPELEPPSSDLELEALELPLLQSWLKLLVSQLDVSACSMSSLEPSELSLESELEPDPDPELELDPESESEFDLVSLSSSLS